MNIRCRNMLVCGCVVGIGAIAGTLAMAQPAKDKQPGAESPAMPLPPGWTAEDMQCMIAAGTPGEMHEWLAKSAGTWQGRTQMWMGPAGGEPMTGECTQKVSAFMDGRYVKGEMSGELPGMGPFTGFGVTGFDNVTQKFVGSWVDNHSTGIMNGVGELSKDRKTLTWNFTYNCPITKKTTTMRQIETYTNANTMSFEMFATDPKSGKEYKCMKVDFTRMAK